MTAKSLGISQPAVSEHIQSLENEFQLKLFLRKGRKIELSSAGKCLVGHANKLLRQYETAQKELMGFLDEPQGELVIGASSTPGNYLLPGVLAVFQRQYPKVRPRLVVSNSRQVAEDLAQHKVELGLVGSKWKQAGFHFEPWKEDQLFLAVPPGHALAGKKEVELSDLTKERILIREQDSGTRSSVQKAFQAKGLNLEDNLAGEFSSTEAIKNGVISGLGVSILSGVAMRMETQTNSLVSLPIKGLKMQRSFYLMIRRDRQLSPLAELFMSFLQNWA